MQSDPTPITYEVDLQPGESLMLPADASKIVGPGQWQIIVQPAGQNSTRDHTAFLNSYAPEDEGLYDDYPGG